MASNVNPTNFIARDVIINFLLVLATVIFGFCGVAISWPTGFVGTFLPALGISLAFVIFYGYRCMIGVFFGTLILFYFMCINYHFGATTLNIVQAAPLYALLSLFQVWIITRVVHRSFDMPIQFHNISEIINFLFKVIIIGGLTEFIIVYPLFSHFEIFNSENAFGGSVIWTFGTILGIVTFLPIALLCFPGNGVSARRRFLVGIPFLFLIVVATITLVMFFRQVQTPLTEFQEISFDSSLLKTIIWYEVVVPLSLIIIVVTYIIFITGRSEHFEQIMNERTKEFLQYQKFLRIVIDNLPSFMIVKDNNMKIVEANKAYFDIFNPAEHYKILGSTMDGMLPEEEVKEIMKAEEKALKYGYSENIEDVTNYKKITRTYLTRRVAFKNDTQNKFVLSVSTDVTDLKKKEEELVRSNKELEQFASIASHDLQHPLRAVTGFMELLDMNLGDKKDEKSDQYIKMSIAAVHQMNGLIDDLLQFAKMGSRESVIQTFNSTESFASLETLLSFEIEENNASLNYENLPEIDYDPEQFGRLIMNIVGNAIKYRGDADPVIDIKANRYEEGWIFSIADNGPGIDPKYKQKVFDMFYRLDETAETKSGTGIGLATCKKIVERHGGTIWLESEVGKGTAFYFSVPDEKPDQ